MRRCLRRLWEHNKNDGRSSWGPRGNCPDATRGPRRRGLWQRVKVIVSGHKRP